MPVLTVTFWLIEEPIITGGYTGGGSGKMMVQL
jgi:hypothetical protein